MEEHLLIDRLTRYYKKSAFQKNKVHESDAEIIQIPNTDTLLAITIDSLAEEIEHSLYTDPYQIGWMTVMINASDLAAVGANPLGIVVEQTLLKKHINTKSSFLDDLQKGIADASSASGLYVLGGDTNFAKKMHMTGAALGVCPQNRYMKRRGCNIGDILATTNKAGLGNAFAYAKLFKDSQKNCPKYFPHAKLKEGKKILKYATSCIDTSDGLFASIEELGRLNRLGFQITASTDEILHDEAKKISLPSWMMLAGHHGDFELLFTVPEKKWPLFKKEFQKQQLPFIQLGVAVKQLGINFEKHHFSPGVIKKTWSESKNNIKKYMQNLLKLGGCDEH